MSTALQAVIAEPAAPTEPIAPAAETSRLDRIHRLSIDRYNRMVDAGIFGGKEPIFLWKGQLVEKMTKNPPHANAVTALSSLIKDILPPGWHVRSEQPMEIPDDSVPEPDLTVVRGSWKDYPRRAPGVRDVILVVEVSDSTVAEDQGEVLTTYAEALIPNYWIVNIPQSRFQVYADPTGPADSPSYRSCILYNVDEFVPLVLDGREVGRVAARDVLP